MQGKIVETGKKALDNINGTPSKWDLLLKSKNSGVSKYDIAGWVMRAWTPQIEDLSATDQVNFQYIARSVWNNLKPSTR